MLAVSSNIPLPISWTPKRVADEAQVLAVLRQELRNLHEDPDGEVIPPKEPMFRTVDADTLSVLRHPTYPFMLCEGAPALYAAPMPYDAVRVSADLSRRLDVFDEHLHTVYRARVSEVGECASADRMEFFLSVLSGDASFSRFARDASELRWYLRWSASHSLVALDRACEQIHYVLSEFGVPSAAALEKAAQSVPFFEALETIAADRRDAVESERRRMRSQTRTFRARLAPASITAATSSYLSAEEKFRFQEFYNDTEHALALLKHTVQAHYASAADRPNSRDRAVVFSRGNSPRSSAQSVNSAESAQSVKSAQSAKSAEHIECAAAAALRTMRRERGEIDALLRAIREREARGAAADPPPLCGPVAAARRRRSRGALAAVFARALADRAVLRAHVRRAAAFLAQFDEWLGAACGCDHAALIARMMPKVARGGEEASGGRRR